MQALVIIPILLFAGCQTLRGPDFYERMSRMGCEPTNAKEVKRTYEHSWEMDCRDK